MRTTAARTLALLRRAGFLAEVVERWLPIPGRHLRRDLFHVGDVLAVHPAQRTFLLVQTTSMDHVAQRLAKAKARPELGSWLAAGGAFEVHGWTKRGGKWAVKRVAVEGLDLAAVVIVKPPRRRGGRRQRQRSLFD